MRSETQKAEALRRAAVKRKAYHTLAAHWFKTYAYQAHAETLFDAQSLSLTLSWAGALSKLFWIVQVSDILYLSLSISAERLLPVNKVEIVKGSTQLRDDIRRFCQITHTITSIYSVTESITCKNQVIIDLLLWTHLEFKSKLPTLLPMEACLALTSRWGKVAILACLFS